MKSKNLMILRENGINVPKFSVVSSVDEVTPVFMFTLSHEKKYAVRSSFSAEDGRDLSYAGQFDTLLNVPKNEIKEAVAKVFESYNKENVRLYTEAKKSKRCDGAGRVIVQEMVDADFSGVVFTANPLGILNETVITVGRGCGCNVVEDKIYTTSYYYNRDDDLYYSEQHGDSPSLSEEKLKEIIALSENIKNIFLYEADIEFAIKDDIVYVLQVRPITTISGKNPIILDNSNIVESYPGISLPLTQDFVRSVYYEIFFNCILRLTEDDDLVDELDEYLQDMTDIANWRIYYRISNWYAVLKMLPFSKKIIKIWQKMLGVNNKYISSPNVKIPLKTKIRICISVMNFLYDTPLLMEQLNRKFEKNFPKYEKLIEEAENINALLLLYRKIRDEVLSDWDITLINDMYTFIHTGLAGEENEALIADIKNLESMKPVLEIQKLIEIAKTKGIDSVEYREAAQKYIAKFGDRCLAELKLETKTYRTHPELLDAYVKEQMSQKSIVISPARHEKECKNQHVEKAKIGIKNREISRMNRSRLYGLTRTIFRKIGQIYVNQNKLIEVDDVFYLHLEEIELSQQDWRKIVEERKKEYACYCGVPAYSRLVFDNHVVHKTGSHFNAKILNKKDVLTGTVTSSGKVRAEVMIVDAPNDRLDTTGKILVTKTTDPGWVFLVKNAEGIVAEKGSLLSHTAIISRELHKPAVVNVKDCTRVLNNGDLVELDADAGTVTILKRGANNGAV